jgi:Uma2 family endonuclease
MATTITVPRTTSLPTRWSLADVQKHLGGIPFERIRSFPPPGFATVEDVEEIQANEDRLFELIDGILVEKAMRYFESFLSMLIGLKLTAFVVENQLGMVLGEAGGLRILPNQIRITDVCFLQAGVRLVWYIDPPTRSATVYASAEDQGTNHTETEPLSGGDVLPGFTLSLAEIFRQAGR